MNWFKENPFLAGLIGAVILGGGVLGYLISGAASRFAEISQSYDAQAAELIRLSGLPLYPNEANVARLSAQKDEFKSKVAEIKERLVSMTPPEEEITPADFQAKLRERVDDFTARAKAANVSLPEDFYLGFDAYRSGPPSSDAVAKALNRQLAVIEKTLNVFLAQRVAEIRAVNRDPLPEERGTGAQPAAQTGPPRPGGPGGRQGAQAELVVSSPFEVSVLAEQDRVRRSLNEIARLPFFVPVRSLSIKNTNPVPPKRSEVSAPQPPAPATDLNALFGGQSGGQGAQPAQRLEFIVGTERVELVAKLEYTLFP